MKASYGLKDRGLFMDGPESSGTNNEIEQKLKVLKELADSGEISQHAFESARDRYRIYGVMGQALSAKPRE